MLRWQSLSTVHRKWELYFVSIGNVKSWQKKSPSKITQHYVILTENGLAFKWGGVFRGDEYPPLVALRPNASNSHLILEVSRSHIQRPATVGRTALNE